MAGIIKRIETKNAQNAIGAFPSKDGGYPAFPERAVTMDPIAKIVNLAETNRAPTPRHPQHSRHARRRGRATFKDGSTCAGPGAAQLQAMASHRQHLRQRGIHLERKRAVNPLCCRRPQEIRPRRGDYPRQLAFSGGIVNPQSLPRWHAGPQLPDNEQETRDPGKRSARRDGHPLAINGKRSNLPCLFSRKTTTLPANLTSRDTITMRSGKHWEMASSLCAS